MADGRHAHVSRAQVWGAGRGRSRGQAGPGPLDRVWRAKDDPNLRSAATLGLVLLGPVLALLTFLVLGPLSDLADAPGLRLIILADMVYILVVAALVLREGGAHRWLAPGAVGGLAAAPAADRPSSPSLALVPTILVAVFATITVNMGLEGVVFRPLAVSRAARQFGGDAAEAYSQEHRDDLSTDTVALANFLNINRRATLLHQRRRPASSCSSQGQARIQRGLEEGLRHRRERRRDFPRPRRGELPVRLTNARAMTTSSARANGELVLIEDREQNEFRALLRLTAFPDRYLYVSREVDGDILRRLLDESAADRAALPAAGGRSRPRVLFEFGLLYSASR